MEARQAACWRRLLKYWPRGCVGLAMPVSRALSPSDVTVCPGFLLGTFQTVGALTSFEFSDLGWPPVNTDGQSDPKPTKLTPRYRHAHFFYRILSWNSASRPPLFLPSYSIVPQVRPSI